MRRYLWLIAIMAMTAIAADDIMSPNGLRLTLDNGEATPPDGCMAPNCPELDVTYIPKLPPLGTYSEPGVCEAIHPNDFEYTVTLQDGETLEDAAMRLAERAEAEGIEIGGVIEVPWHVDTVQCDSFRIRNGHINRGLTGAITIRGIPNPNTGELPRFYCRSSKLGGTIDDGLAGTFFWATAPQTMLENIHVDGYGAHTQSDMYGYHAFRNNYFHHATNDGHGVNGFDESKFEPGQKLELHFCGNEFSHSGQGNAKHCLYLHRGDGDQHKYHMTFVDNVVHSCNWSEGFKSTAEYNFISGNRFYKTPPPDEYQPTNPDWKLETDPSYPVNYGNTLVNVPACAYNVIRNNVFHNYRPDPDGFAQSHSIQVVSRRGIHGCDMPKGYAGEYKESVPIPDSVFWSETYWQHPDAFETVIENNTFEIAGPDARGYGIEVRTTYPITAVRQFGPSCLMEAPQWWVERSKVISRNNTFIGFETNERSEKYAAYTTGHDDSCESIGFPYPSTAHLQTTPVIEIQRDMYQ